MTANPTWELSGTYLECCNCDPVCPCRRIDDVPGGRSTHGVCLGALSWHVDHGHAEEIDLSGLNVVLALRYEDDEPGSPWSFFLYLDERGDERQRSALSDIFLGRSGGTPQEQFPWVWKESDLLGVRPARIELDHTPGRGWFRTDGNVTVRVRSHFAEPHEVTCVIPGHHRTGTEVVAESLKVADPPLEFELTGTCGYESTFAYSGAAAP